MASSSAGVAARLGRLGLALSVPAVLATCGQEGGRARGTGLAEGDSAGIHIVENPSPDALPPLTVGPEPTLGIGRIEGAPEEQLYQVSAAVRLSDGRIAVANAGSRELRIYDADGAHLATAGGAGQGPSEFRYPVGIAVLPGDTLLVQDMLDRVRFDSSGAFLGRVTTDLARLQELAGPDAFAEGGTWLPDGSLFVPIHQRQVQVPPQPGPPFRPRSIFLRFDPSSGVVDTLGAFGGIRQQYVRIAPGPRGVSAASQPFSVSTAWAKGPPDGTLLVADSERPELHLFRGDGAHVLVRWVAEREPLTDEEWEAWKERQRSSSWAKDRLPALERAWAAMEVPERKAAYGRNVAIGRDGSVWIPESSDIDPSPATFLVFEPDGRLRGRATLPGPFRVMDAGADWVLGVWLDANGVEFLRLWPIGS